MASLEVACWAPVEHAALGTGGKKRSLSPAASIVTAAVWNPFVSLLATKLASSAGWLVSLAELSLVCILAKLRPNAGPRTRGYVSYNLSCRQASHQYTHSKWLGGRNKSARSALPSGRPALTVCMLAESTSMLQFWPALLNTKEASQPAGDALFA